MKFVRNTMAHKMHIKFSKWRQCFLMKKIIINCVMDTRFELQYKGVAEL